MSPAVFHLRALATIVLPVVFVSPRLQAQITDTTSLSQTPIQIRITRPAKTSTIPNTVFGSFLEPIGHSTYGGLWADVIENPSFEDGLWSAGNVVNMLRARPELRRASELGIPLPWEPLDETQGARYLPIWGDAANSSRSLLVMSMPNRETGIRQMVYLPVQRELFYTGSVWLKHVRGSAKVSVSIRVHSHPDRILTTADLDAGATTWTNTPSNSRSKKGKSLLLNLQISSSPSATMRVCSWIKPHSHLPTTSKAWILT